MSVLTPLKEIVLPLDGSEFAARAIPAADVIARAAGTGISLLGIAADDDEAAAISRRLRDARTRLSGSTDVAEELFVGADPVAALLEVVDDPARTLFLASHDRMPPTAAVLQSVGSRVIERARRPLFVVGTGGAAGAGGPDVVVALDGRHDPEPLLTAAARWAARLQAPLRVVTVYEPVPADIRNSEHFTRGHGPETEPDLYLRQVCARLEGRTPHGVEYASIPDPVSVSTGLSDHLAERPALILVCGAQHHPNVFAPGVVRVLLHSLTVPVLLVPAASADGHPVLETADRRSSDA